MNDERWATVDRLFEAALERQPDERASFLREACPDDEALRQDVESLLAHASGAGDFLEGPALELVGGVPVEGRDPSLVGHQLGPYRILSVLGIGGMGEVYRAHDTTLARDVAIKILPRLFTTDPDRRARFDREARLLAALNHPHIGAIYGVQDSDGIRALVLELVDGPTLQDRIGRSQGLSIGEALHIARQIADALEAAHEKGIVHRDLKPANIKITPDGVVKVLDFGLAKAASGDASGPNLTQLPTVTIGGTREGVILGTAAYMSPEHARGSSVDKRTDIWAFGCVLYEMLTGRRAFPGDTISDTIAAVLEREPDWQALPSATPDKVRDLLRRCLRKDPHSRLRDIGDARLDIDDAQGAEATGQPATQIVSHRERLAWMAAAVLAAAAVAALVWAGRPEGSMPVAPEMRVEITTPPTSDLVSMEISPDGQRIVFVATFEGRPRLWLRRLDTVLARPLPGTDLAALPFWSPDGRSIGFFANQRLRRIDLDGGTVQPLARVEVGLGGTWTRDGVILFGSRTGGSIYRVSENGGEVTSVTEVHAPQLGHRFPQILPDGLHFLYYVAGPPETSGVYVARLNGSDTRRVFSADSAAIHTQSGHLLFIRQGTLYAQRFDPVTLTAPGTPFSVAERVALESRFGRPALSASPAGPIVYRGAGNGGQQHFVWFDRTGRATGTFGERSALDLSHPSLSPDGRHVAVSRTVAGNTDVWLLDTIRDTLSRFTTHPGNDIFPLWSSDGSLIVYGSQRRGRVGADLYEQSATGSQEKELLAAASVGLTNVLLDDWSPDGRFILFRDVSPKGGYDLWALPVKPLGKPFPVVQTQFEEGGAQFSRDGNSIAYQSDESGRSEIYVQPFPAPGARTPISTTGGTQARWSRDGKELFYIALDGRLMAVPMRVSSDGTVPAATTPVPLFQTRILGGLPGQGSYRQQYMVARDGRFLMHSVVQEDTSPIIVILNWKPSS
jgi:eukaryotic-like serine/threonine-protein kinase